VQWLADEQHPIFYRLGVKKYWPQGYLHLHKNATPLARSFSLCRQPPGTNGLISKIYPSNKHLKDGGEDINALITDQATAALNLNN
jgi:hypothetical protein